MPTPTIIKGVVIEDGGATLLARIVGNAGTVITQATITSITYQEFKKGTTIDIAVNSPLTVSSVVFDALQTDAIWTIDSTGYNFSYAAAATEFPDGRETYEWEFKFTPSTGQVFYILYSISTIGLIGS
jgi:hypothetical protein